MTHASAATTTAVQPRSGGWTEDEQAESPVYGSGVRKVCDDARCDGRWHECTCEACAGPGGWFCPKLEVSEVP